MAANPDRRRELLVEELKEAVGEEAVERADLDVDRALERQPSKLGAAFGSARLLLIVAGAALVVVGVIASLALENWLFFAVAIAVHAVLTVVVVGSALALTTEVEKPAPTVEAALQDQGVSDPSGALNDLVEQVQGEEEGSRTRRLATESADDTGPPEQDAANAAARQQASTTPASEPTQKAGERS
jgi:hypothetical protein